MIHLNKRVREIHARIKEWLLEAGYTIKKRKDTKSFFNYTIAKGNLPSLNVLQPKENRDSIVVIFGIEFDMKSAEKIRSNDEMLWKIRKWLLQSGCRFGFFPNLQSFNVIRAFRTLFYDGLTKNSFFRTIDKVTDAGLFVAWTIQREIGEMPARASF